MKDARYSLSICRAEDAWTFRLYREFYRLGIAVLGLGPVRIVWTWPVPGFGGDAEPIGA